MQNLDSYDILFVGGFVAAFCFAIAAFLYVSAPPGLPGFIDALIMVFLGLGGGSLILAILGAGLVSFLSGNEV